MLENSPKDPSSLILDDVLFLSPTVLTKEELSLNHKSQTPQKLQRLNTHQRTGTTLIKDEQQTYQFVSAVTREPAHLEGEPAEEDQLSALSLHSLSSSSSFSLSQLDKELRVFSTRRTVGGHSILNESGRMYCPACNKVVPVVVQYKTPEVPLFKKILCCECVDRQRSYLVLQCCKCCDLVLTRVKHLINFPN